MKIYHSPEDFARLSHAVVTSGTFDGVHVGHQKILHRLKEIALQDLGETVVITFWPHPQMVLHPENTSLKLLNTFEEKAELLKSEGIQHLLRIPFTKEFSHLSSLDFIQKILVQTIGTKKLVIGYDHRFGHNREGSFEQLKINGPAYGFDVEEISRQDVDHISVSSSKIRQSLSNADIETANQLLGKPYSLTGQVATGDKLGRVLGFPTANIEIDSRYKLIPVDGIYAVTIKHEHQLYKGMLYLGPRPTVDGTKHVIEVNLFDFDKEIYGENVTVYIHFFLRADQKFNDLEALKQQLHTDKKDTVRILENITFAHYD
ncbi:MAG: bifunctional riboflavin kinase/FAD synthetase [Bacteroidetes bacterium]|nr:bifunctional riboflavin kinase/FAD synthetase [Bacteroidota bacterium]